MMRFLLPALLLISSTANALGVDVTYEEIVTHHQNQISWVATCGSWQDNNHNGVYRITHASLYGQSFLYAQWMETSQEGINTVRHTLSIPELNNDHAEISLEKLQCKSTKTGVTISAKAYFGHEAKDGSVLVSVFHSPGKYHFERHPR